MTTTQSSHQQVAFDIPNISNEDLVAFHESHFGESSSASFNTTFLNPVGGQDHVDAQAYEVWDEEDDLGYYEDGVKRTLTDEQIEIFRHSELETLRKKQEKALSSKPSGDVDESTSENEIARTQTEASDVPQQSRSGKKKKKKKAGNRPRPEPKPDLRKRTWDVVEKGLDTLDYD